MDGRVEPGIRFALSHQTSTPPPNWKNERKKLDAAKAIDRPKTIWISRRNPPEVSPKASVRPVMTMITASVAGVIEPALAEAEQQRVLRKPPERLDAWEAYQRGLWHFYKDDAEENQTAQTFFRQAIAL